MARGYGDFSGVRIDGLNELVRNLQKFGTETDDLKAGFRKVGNLIAEEGQSLAPKVSGALAASIRPSNAKNKTVIRAGSARVPYARVQHFGWPARNITGQFFLYDAVDSTQGAAVELLNDEIKTLIRRLGL